MRNFVVPGGIAALCLFLAGCTVDGLTSPARTATEELPIFTVADQAATKLDEQIAPHLKIFLDTTSINAPDASYATLAIRERLLRQGSALIEDKAWADAEVQVRSAQFRPTSTAFFSARRNSRFPLFRASRQRLFSGAVDRFVQTIADSTAKFAATGYDPKTGQLVLATDPQYGYSHKIEWAFLLFFPGRIGITCCPKKAPTRYAKRLPNLRAANATA
jgi:hypothetical protein